jgi:quinol monooxygenase YgiN
MTRFSKAMRAVAGLLALPALAVYAGSKDTTTGTLEGQPQRRGIQLPSLPDPDPGENGPYCLISRHRAKPGLADAYEKRMLADLDRTRAEPGALLFYIHRDRSDRNLFVLYEVWRDVKALRDHFREPYVLRFVADSAEYIDGNMEVQWLVMAGDYAGGKR